MKRLKTISAILIIFLMAVLSSTATAQEDVKIIVNASNPVSTMTRTDLIQIFKGTKSSWSDGSKITLVVQEKELPGFYELIDTPKRKFDKHWITVTLSGKANAPKYVSGDASSIQYVRTVQNSIGFVSSGVSLSEVNEVKIIR